MKGLDSHDINGEKASVFCLFICQEKKRSPAVKCDKSHCRNYCVLSIIHAEDSGPRCLWHSF